jgi:YesN/AraC family two-component response regulator
MPRRSVKRISFLFARDGVEALAALKANGQIDLVVTDINMPRMDGLLLLQKLQENEKQVSTIVVSAHGDMSNIRTAMNRGAFDFVTKPIDFQDLHTTINKTIRHIELLRDARQRQAVAERAYASGRCASRTWKARWRRSNSTRRRTVRRGPTGSRPVDTNARRSLHEDTCDRNGRRAVGTGR